MCHSVAEFPAGQEGLVAGVSHDSFSLTAKTHLVKLQRLIDFESDFEFLRLAKRQKLI